MSSPNKRYRYELARPGDSLEILQILEETDFKGQISLVYTRRPDPYGSFAMEGRGTIVIVGRDLQKGQLAGMGAYTTRRLYVNGAPTEVGYLFGLRVRQEYRKTALLLPQGYRMLQTLLQGSGVKYHLTTILAENKTTQQLLEKQRPFMPGYLPLTRYGTFIFPTVSGNAGAGGPSTLKQAIAEDVPAILQFLQVQGRQLQFFPALEEASFGGAFPGLGISNFYMMVDHRQSMVACGALWNQNTYKQYLVKGYGSPLKYIYPVSGVFRPLGFPKLPQPGTILNFATLSFWAVRDDDPAVFRRFLQTLATTRTGVDFFVVGMSESHPLRPVAQKMARLSYWSKAYLVDWEKEGIMAELDPGWPVYLECGWL